VTAELAIRQSATVSNDRKSSSLRSLDNKGLIEPPGAGFGPLRKESQGYAMLINNIEKPVAGNALPQMSKFITPEKKGAASRSSTTGNGDLERILFHSWNIGSVRIRLFAPGSRLDSASFSSLQTDRKDRKRKCQTFVRF